MPSVKQFFDAAYRSEPRYWWREPSRYSTDPDDHPSSLLTQLMLRHVRGKPPGRALDLGCGEGADAIRLARLGWEVDAVEISEVGAAKTESFAREEGVGLTVWCMDAAAFTAGTPYDLVVCNGVLHYVEDKRALIERIQRMTASGGSNLVSLWSDYSPVPPCHRIVATHPDQEEGVTTSSYASWRKELLYFERNRSESSHCDMEPHVHSFIKLLAVQVDAAPQIGT